MDAFEALMATLLERKGYWVRPSLKVELTKEEKRKIGRPTAPRWELDVVAYSGVDNKLLVVECKSYLDSRGVVAESFTDSSSPTSKRFKLFNNDTLRETVFRRLKKQLTELGACQRNPKVQLCLAAGHIATEQDRDLIKKHFNRKRWLLWDEHWLEQELTALSGTGYDNDVAAVVAKILLRGKKDRNTAVPGQR